MAHDGAADALVWYNYRKRTKGQHMTKDEFAGIESYMLGQMRDSAHDRHHVYRVLNAALDIAGHEGTSKADTDTEDNSNVDADTGADGVIETVTEEEGDVDTSNEDDGEVDVDTGTDNDGDGDGEVDVDVLIAACLLHDIGREAQSANPGLCHAQVGGGMAFGFLVRYGWSDSRAAHVKDCITTHRFRAGSAPQSIEAKILFDADKLEASGAIGIARTLIYGGQVSEPMYIMDESGAIVVDGGGADISSFMQEYNYKLKKVYSTFYTERAKEIAACRQAAAIDFYESLHSEISENYENGINKYRFT